FVASIRGLSPHQRQRIVECIICTPTPKCCWSLCVDLFRQYHNVGIREEVWRYHFSKITQDFRRHMGSLPENQHPPPDDVCAYIPESSGCSQQIDCSNRVVNPEHDLQQDHLSLWYSRRGPICNQEEHQGTQLLQLVPGQGSSRNQRLVSQLDSMVQPVLLSTLEPDPTGITEGEEGEVNINSNNPLLEISNLVPRPVEINSSTADNTRSICDCPRPQKRKVSHDRQQELVTRAMEDQRSSLETEGYSEHAIRLMEPNQRAIKRRTRNSAIQQGFLDWLETNKDRCNRDTISLINYLSEIYSTKSLKIGTLKAYKSSIVQWFKSAKINIDENKLYSFINNIEEMSIKSFVKGNINITASLNYISSLGQTDQLKTKDLTAKTCWLIAICGLMRASDIHRIDDIRTIRKDNSVVFVILAPKEKRQGRPIERPCEIKSHTNLMFCPVHAYDVYKARMAMIPCPRPHINDKNLTVNHLFRYVNNPEKPLTVDSISRNIKSVSKFMVNEGE
ncbi:hypothetical protein AYI69_g9523, partial [Smittium culicis]